VEQQIRRKKPQIHYQCTAFLLLSSKIPPQFYYERKLERMNGRGLDELRHKDSKLAVCQERLARHYLLAEILSNSPSERWDLRWTSGT
jgi:hypothetical protein